MKIKIIDLNLFEKSNGIHFTRDINFQYEYEVLAISDYRPKTIWESSKNRKSFLLLIKFNNDYSSFHWCVNNESIKVMDNSVDEKWVKLKSHAIKSDEGTVIFRNLYSPKWMTLTNELFLYDVSMNNGRAIKTFEANEYK